MMPSFDNRIASFVARLLALAAALGTFATGRADAADEPNSNRWTIVFYDSSSPDPGVASALDADARANFEGFVETVRARERDAGDASNVVVFSPFESRPNRRPTPENARAILDWIRDSGAPSKALDLPALRVERNAPVDLRLFIDVAVRGARVVLGGRTGEIGIRDLERALGESQPRVERVLKIENRRSQGTAKGAAPFAVRPGSFGSAEETGASDSEPTSVFSQSRNGSTFQATSSEDYFALLREALDGYADTTGPYRISDGVITLVELLEYLRSSCPEAPRPNYEGAGVSELYRETPIVGRKAPDRLFLELGKRLGKPRGKEPPLDPALASEAWKREWDLDHWDDDDFKAAGFKSPDYSPLSASEEIEKIEIFESKDYRGREFVRITRGAGSGSIWSWLDDVQRVADQKKVEKERE